MIALRSVWTEGLFYEDGCRFEITLESAQRGTQMEGKTSPPSDRWRRVSVNATLVDGPTNIAGSASQKVVCVCVCPLPVRNSWGGVCRGQSGGRRLCPSCTPPRRLRDNTTHKGRGYRRRHVGSTLGAYRHPELAAPRSLAIARLSASECAGAGSTVGPMVLGAAQPTDEDQCMWACPVVKSSSNSGLATLAEKVPATKPSKDQKEQNRRHMIRGAIVKLVDFVMKNPSAAIPLWASVEGDLIADVSARSADKKLDLSKVTSFGKVPAELLASWLRGLKGGPSQQTLDKMHTADSQILHDIGTLILQLRRSNALPKSLQDDRVLLAFFTLRADEIGKRYVEWFEKCINGQTGEVNWAGKPLYDFEWDDEHFLKSVTHISGEKVDVPSHVRIKKDFQVQNPHSDLEAALVMPPLKQVVAEFFPKGAGPWKFDVDKRSKSLNPLFERALHKVTDAEKKANDAIDAVESLETTSCTLEGRKKRLREEALNKARKAIESKVKRARSMVLE